MLLKASAQVLDVKASKTGFYALLLHDVSHALTSATNLRQCHYFNEVTQIYFLSLM